MSGTWTQTKPHRVRRRAALTLVFAGVLATGAVTGSWGDESGDGSDGAGRPLAGAAAAQSFSAPSAGRGSPGGSDSAEELVSRSGDRWSAAYTAREYQGLQQTLSGRYVGVGVSVHRSGGPTGRDIVSVAEVQPGSPAAEAGVRPGDRLHAVDGHAVAGRPVTDVVAQLRGSPVAGESADGPGLHPSSGAAPGSTVHLDLGRDGHRRQVTLHRAQLDAHTVTVDRLPGAVTRITITCFTRGAGREVRRAVQDAPPGTGFLLDLRGNSGGLVREAVRAASAFLDGGLVATYDDHGAQRALYAARGGDTGVPLVVLVDGGTMSAAELLTGALQDRGRAVVVGSRTFGKGSVQIPREMPDGSVAELTVGHYATPSGRSVQGTGIAPDLDVPPGDALSQARTVLGGLEDPS